MPINPTLKSFIDASRSAGVPDTSIREQLVANGWNPEEVKSAFGEVSPPIPVAPIPTSPLQSTQNTPLGQQQKEHRSAIITGLLVIALIATSIAYAYVEKIGPFAVAPYSEHNLLSGILARSSEINSSEISFFLELKTEPRDADALPFAYASAGSADFSQQYLRDVQRTEDVGNILHGLDPLDGAYPSSLSQLLTRGHSFKLADPKSGSAYLYLRTENGKKFTLTVSFETDDAITAIQNEYGFSPAHTIIQGKTVTFTQDSSPFIYLPRNPPKPFLTEISESAEYLPNEISVQGSIGATTDFKNADEPEGKAYLDASGSFGDLSYAINVEWLRKDKLYFFRINKMPSLFLGEFSSLKGTWVKIDPSQPSLALSEFITPGAIQEAENDYKKERERGREFMYNLTKFADEENLFTFPEKPRKERINGQTLYRYDLAPRRDAIPGFYRKLLQELGKDSEFRYLAEDVRFIDYLASDEFKTVFDYYAKNTTLTVWTDAKGFPALVEYSLRLVPGDNAQALKDKQVQVTARISLSKINEPVSLEAPADAKTFDEIFPKTRGSSGLLEPLADARAQARNAKRIADLQQVQLALTIYYDTYNTYPPNLQSLTPDLLPQIPLDLPGEYEAAYNPYTNAQWNPNSPAASGKNACTVSGACKGYHLGISLEPSSSIQSYLLEDADIAATGAGATINGSDEAACNPRQTAGSACYDLRN